MRTIYLVSAGEYSDYSVWCAFETKELAEEYCATYLAIGKAADIYLYGQEPSVEELQLWDALPIVKANPGHYPEIDDGLSEPVPPPTSTREETA